MKFIKSLMAFAFIMIMGQQAMAQSMLVTRERTGYTSQVDFKVINSSGSSLTYRYEWLMTPEPHYFYLSNITTIEVTANTGGVIQHYTIPKSNIDAYNGAYFEVWPSSSAISPLLYIRNSNPLNPGLNQYSFYLGN